LGGFVLFSQLGPRMGAAYAGWVNAVSLASSETPAPGGP
jgi:hypothetical protein